MAETGAYTTEMGETTNHLNWQEVIGPFYKIDGKDNTLWFCRESWQNAKIPFLYGRKQIGKTNILSPYLKSALGKDVSIFEPSDDFDRLVSLSPHTIILASIHGTEEDTYDVQCNNQIKMMCNHSKLFRPDMFNRGRIELKLNNDDVDLMVRHLTGSDTKNSGLGYVLGRRKVVSAFHQYRPISNGIEALKKLLGNKFPPI